jgi:hypothetical protein
MSYLIAILVSLLLLTSFVLWSWFETRSGFRVLAGPRRVFDRQVAKTTFVIIHIDWGAFALHVGKTTLERVAHDVVHTTLLLVRATERTLTRLIRSLRERVARHDPPEDPIEGSQLIATLIRFRKSLRKERAGADKNDKVEPTPG